MKVNKQKDFETLLHKALNEWPKEMSFDLLYQSNSSESRYSVKGLFELCEKITKPYLGTADEILMRNLHDAIYGVLHGLAAFCDRVNLKQLRKEAVQRDFENRLEYCQKQKNAGWTNEDRKLIGEYFKDTSRGRAVSPALASGRAPRKSKKRKE